MSYQRNHYANPKDLRDLKKVNKLWGHETHIHNANGYCGKRLFLNEGPTEFVPVSSIHYHVKKHETLQCAVGVVGMEIFNATWNSISQRFYYPTLWKRFFLSPGQSISLEPYTVHRFWNARRASASEFLEFSTEDDPSDSIRIEDSHWSTNPAHTGESPRAFRVDGIAGFSCVVFAMTRSRATILAMQAAEEAGYNPTWRHVRTWRYKEADDTYKDGDFERVLITKDIEHRVEEKILQAERSRTEDQPPASST